jgi:hypothetical protein
MGHLPSSALLKQNHLAISVKPLAISSPYLNAILQKDLSFLKSESVPGLQLIDILCNAVRRAIKGNLGKIGWEMIGCLAVQPKSGQNAVQMVDLTATSSRTMNEGDVPYAGVIRQIDRAARPMLTRSLLDENRSPPASTSFPGKGTRQKRGR